jgi:glycine oxidase
MGKHVIILGGGVIGLSAALECQQRGHKVTLLEITACGGQASGAAAGMLAPYSEIAEDPDDFFRLSQQSLKLYPKWQQIVKELSGSEFEYRNTGSLYAIFHDAERLPLETRMKWQQNFGVKASILERDELERIEPNLSSNISAALYCPEESHVYAPDYVKALKQACINSGVVIHEHLEHVNILEWQQNVVLQSKNGQRFYGDTLVISNGAWSTELEDTFGISIPVFPIRGQICAYKMTEPIHHLVFTSQGYLVSKENGSLVCGASEDIAGFDTSVTEKGIARLERWNKKVIPKLHEREPFHRWAGLRPATQDGFPLIGKLMPFEHIIFATGHYRNGILLSPVTANIVADQLDGLSDRLPLDNFNPLRFSITNTF